MPWYTTEDAQRDALRQRREPCTRTPCSNCPFRQESSLGYDADAMEALERGYAPYCHDVVGMDDIFRDGTLTPSDHTACIGFRRWQKRVRGFRKPGLVEDNHE